MIKNEEQLSMIKNWIEIFKKAIKEKEQMREFWETDVHPILHQVELDGMNAKLKELEQEVADYKA